MRSDSVSAISDQEESGLTCLSTIGPASSIPAAFSRFFSAPPKKPAGSSIAIGVDHQTASHRHGPRDGHSVRSGGPSDRHADSSPLPRRCAPRRARAGSGRRLDRDRRGSAGARARPDPDEDDAVVVGERGNRRLVPARLLPGRPVGMPADRVEEGGVQDQVPGHARDAGRPSAPRPTCRRRRCSRRRRSGRRCSDPRRRRRGASPSGTPSWISPRRQKVVLNL